VMTAQCLLPFRVSVSQVHSVYCTAVNVRFLSTIFEEGSGNIFLWLPDMSLLSDMFFIACWSSTI
jgi:hypothetical protein